MRHCLGLEEAGTQFLMTVVIWGNKTKRKIDARKETGRAFGIPGTLEMFQSS